MGSIFRRKMSIKNNKGSISIFVTLLCLVLVGLFSVIMKSVNIRNAQSKASMALKSAVSSIKADYNRYIFDNYHILLFDITYYGKGEGYTEELIKSYMEYTLGSGFTVKDVVLSDVNHIEKNDVAALKHQINDYMKYSAGKNVAEKLLEKAGVGSDKNENIIDEKSLLEMDKEAEDAADKMDSESGKPGKSSGNNNGNDGTDKQEKNSDEEAGGNTHKDKEDPRVKTRIMTPGIVALFVKPDDANFCENIINVPELPSFTELKSVIKKINGVDVRFEDYGNLRGSLTEGDGWGKELKNRAVSIAYANEVFKSLRDNKGEKETFVNLEREYLICGEITDQDNYTSIVKKLVNLRFGFNFGYIIKDKEKMARLSALAKTLTVFAPYLQPVMKYLLAGSWAYIESCSDAKYLVKGHKIKLMKEKKDWKTDLYDSLEMLAEEPEGDDEEGLDYDEYLMILMGLEGDIVFYRMLDLMEINTAIQYPDFKMKNAVVEFAVKVTVEYGDKTFELNKEEGY